VTDLSNALGFALDVARLGGRIAMGHFGKQPTREQKADGTWVTEADWAAEAQIRIRIARSFPDHNVLGEEEGLTAAGGGPARDGAPTWVIDPIDGTHNYMAGIPIWATLVALQIDGVNVLGVAHAPALNETYDGANGHGARMNGTVIRVERVDNLSQATFLNAGVKRFQEFDMGDFIGTASATAWRDRGFGDFWGHMLVARGAAHVMAEPELSVWDVAALEPIVSEAGGRFTHLDGSPWAGPGSALTTCGGPLHDEIVGMATRG
jgi:histidinol-phosphatase